MKKHKIAAALVCVVFLMGLWGGVAGGQEKPDSPVYWTQTPNVWESWMGGEPPPGSSYFPDWYQLGDQIPAYDNRGTEPLNSAHGVPEPGTLVMLISGGLWLLAWGWRRGRRR